jgi:hypothetical protein
MYYKIPFRQIYCETIRSWIREFVWVFVIYRLYGDYIHQLVGDPDMLPGE